LLYLHINSVKGGGRESKVERERVSKRQREEESLREKEREREREKNVARYV
jgi:hypothetical protein